MKQVGLTILLLVATHAVSPHSAIGQIVVPNIDDAPGSAGGQNCTSVHQSCTLNDSFCWEWNYDANAGPACANSSLVSSPSLGGQAREFDVSWNGSNGNGGAIFHTVLGNTTNLDQSDTAFSYSVWVQYTDLTKITALEFDLNQVIADGDTIIFGTQCYFDGGFWQYTTTTLPHWKDSTIPCTKSDWTLNQWHHIVVSFHRASVCNTPGTCTVTYDSVSFDGATHNFGSASGNSAWTLGWGPVGALLVNHQLDWKDTVNGSMKAYADLFTVNNPKSTKVATPTFSPPAGTYTGPQTVTISTTTSGATLCYTTDGTKPTANGGGLCTHGTIYSGPVTISVTETLKAVGSKNGIDFDSALKSGNYIIN